MTAPITLIDTSAWILALRRHPNPAVRERVAAAIVDESAAICGIILQELLGGTVSEDEFERLAADLRGVTLLPIEERDWRAAARLMFDLRRVGTTVPTADLLIASIAMRHQAVLMHADAHFERLRAVTDDHPQYQGTPLTTDSLLHLLQ